MWQQGDAFIDSQLTNHVFTLCDPMLGCDLTAHAVCAQETYRTLECGTAKKMAIRNKLRSYLFLLRMLNKNKFATLEILAILC